MNANFWKIAFRNLLRHKGFSAINIAGLAIGMASATLILLWIYQEMSYDDFHTQGGRIFRVMRNERTDLQVYTGDGTPRQLAEALKLENPSVAESGRMINCGFVAGANNRNIKINGAFADPSILRIFSFPLVEGQAANALRDVNSIVLTQQTAERIFGRQSAIGQTVNLKSYGPVTVTGILKDLPLNSQFHFDYLLPFTFMDKVGWNNVGWNVSVANTYVLLQAGAALPAVNAAIKNTITRHYTTPDLHPTDIFLQPISKWRLYSRFENGVNVGGRIETVRLFGIIAAFLLLIACINFMNLSTARSEKRAKEVGVRRVAGAGRFSLVSQFLGESITMALVAGFLAGILVWAVLPFFTTLIGQPVRIPWTHAEYWLCYGGFILFTGLLAGSYPAFYFSAFRPVQVLKGTFRKARAAVNPRKILVVAQFTFAITLIIATLIVQRQLHYAQERERGFAKNNTIYYLTIEEELQHSYPAVRNELLHQGIAMSVTKTGSPLTDIWNSSNRISWAGKTPGSTVDFDMVTQDGNLVKTAGMRLLAGRDIDLQAYPADSTGAIINASAAKAMGFKEPVGQTFVTPENVRWTIVGVVQDIIARSPYDATTPTIFCGPKRWTGVVNIRFNPALSTATALERTKAVFEQYNPSYPFEYTFLDASYAEKFVNEQRIGMLGGLFAGLTIFISCLGLFGLATFMASTRKREVGIRKVLGASALDITALLSGEFLALVLVALVLASPVAWWMASTWLQRFAYHIRIGWSVFVLAGGASLLIAAGTVSYQAIHAALANPARSIRNGE